MPINYLSSNEEILARIGAGIKALRIDENLTQSDLADKTGVSERTIGNLESGKDVSLSTLISVMRVLGIVQRLDLAIPEQEIRPSQVYKLGKARQRVGKRRSAENTDWKWGDEE